MDIHDIAGTMIRGEAAYKFPFKYDPRGTEIRDMNGNKVLDIRAWGRLQYHPQGTEAAAALQDAFGEWVASTLNEAYAKHNDANSARKV